MQCLGVTWVLDEANSFTSQPSLCIIYSRLRGADDVPVNQECQDLDAATSINIPKASVCAFSFAFLSLPATEADFPMQCVKYARLLSPLPFSLIDT